MEQIKLEAQHRTPNRKGAAREVRRQGLVPGVVYGRGQNPIPLAVQTSVLSQLLRKHRGASVLFDLKVGGKSPEGVAAIIKELQADPITDELLSVGFQWVSLTEEITVAVPIRLEGLALGVQVGGVLDQALYEVQVSCLPTNIPEELTLDVAALEIGDSLHVSDLTAPEGTEILASAEDSVVTVRPPVIIAEPEPEVEEAEELAEGEEAEVEEGAEPSEEADEEAAQSEEE